MPQARIEENGVYYGTIDIPDELSNEEILNYVRGLKASGSLQPQEEAQAAPMQEDMQAQQPFEGMASGLGQLAESQRPIIEAGQKVTEPIAEGLKRFGAGVGQLAYPAIQALYPESEKVLGNLGERLASERAPQEAAFEEKYGGQVFPQALALGAEIAPSFIGGGAMQLARAPQAIMKAVQNAPRLTRGLAEAGGIFGKNAALAAPYGAITYDPNQEGGGIAAGVQKAAQAAPLGGIIGTGMAGLTRAPQIPGQLISKFGVKERAESALPQMAGLESGFGAAISSPTIKSIEEDFLAKIPFSGVKGSQLKTGIQLEKEGEDILNRLAPNFKGPEGEVNVGQRVLDGLRDYKNSVSEIKTSKYRDVDQLAEANGVFIKPSNLSNAVKEINQNLKKSSASWGATPKSEKNTLQSWLDSFEDIKGGNLTGANIKRGEIGDAIADSRGEFVKGQLSKLRNALTKDIDDAMSGDVPSSVKSAYNDAQSYYRENYAPLIKDRDLMKYLKDGADSDTIVNHFLKKGSEDRPNLFNKLASRIPDEEKSMIARQYLGQAYQKNASDVEMISPNKMIGLYNKLGKRTRDLLFPDQSFKQEIAKYQTRVKNNPSATEALFSPKTGYNNPMVYATLATLGAAAQSAATGNPAPIAIALASIGGAGLAGKFLRSEKIRNMYMKGLKEIEEPGAVAGGLVGGAIGAGIQ